MQKHRTALVFAVAALMVGVVGAARLGAQDVKLTEEKPGLIAQAKVAYTAALATAQARVPNGKLVTAELEQEDGKLIYTMVFKTTGKKGVDEVNVDAVTGKVVAVEHENTEPAAARSKDEKDDKGVKEDKATKKAVKDSIKKGRGGVLPAALSPPLPALRALEMLERAVQPAALPRNPDYYHPHSRRATSLLTSAE